MKIIKKVKKLCLCCMEEHEVMYVQVQESNEFKGISVNYMAEYEYCPDADEYIASDEMISRNDIAMKNAYREQNRLLTSDEIGSIRAKYGMTQTDLSYVLGWGGKTITRYESHQVQDAAHDFILRKIDEDPECFLEILIEGRNKISQGAFLKYYEAIAHMYEARQDVYLRKNIRAQYVKYENDEKYNGGVKLNLDKVVDVIRYFANAGKVLHLYKVKLMKLLWYADNLSYKRRGFALTGLVYKALPMGAVPLAHKSLIDLEGVHYEEEEYAEGSGYRFIGDGKARYSSLTDEDIAVLDKVIEICGDDTKEQIVNRMHKERAYMETTPGEVINFQYAMDLSME